LSLIFALAGAASAAQVQTLPSQQSISVPKIAPRLAPQSEPSNEEALPLLPGGQGPTREIPLPEVFKGCWRGSVAHIDSMEPLDPQAGRTIWLTKSYTLCYKQAGYNGKWRLTFAEGQVADRSQVSGQRQLISVKSVSSPDRAELTAYLHFRAPAVGLFGMRTGIVNTLDELTHLHCYVNPTRDRMEVRAMVFVENNDRPYANMYWHTDFVRVASSETGATSTQ
jgi:hypothetical protein